MNLSAHEWDGVLVNGGVLRIMGVSPAVPRCEPVRVGRACRPKRRGKKGWGREQEAQGRVERSRNADENAPEMSVEGGCSDRPPPPTTLRSGSCWRSVWPSSRHRRPRRRRRSRASISFASNTRPQLRTWRVSAVPQWETAPRMLRAVGEGDVG